MIPALRRQFNQQQFSPERYAKLTAGLNRAVGTEIQFRVCETPCFFPPGLLDTLVETGRALTHQLVDSPAYMQLSDTAIPDRYRVPNENPRPNFMTADFGLVRAEDGSITPKLVELQAFPSVYGYQDLLSKAYRDIYRLDPDLTWRFARLSESGYWDLLRRTVVADNDPENVVLMEVEPEQQKTLPDFRMHELHLGITTVDLTKLVKHGNRLFYLKRGREIPIHRIYNRSIVDEIEHKGIVPAFDFRDDIQVSWAGHPNLFFRISKFSIPYLNHPSVPTAVFLEDWFGGDRKDLPSDRNQLLLKPLFSFAGKGIQFAPTDADLLSIPLSERPNYLLQQRVQFEPVIDTPEGRTQAEIRIMYVWPDEDAEMTPVTSLVRLGRGLMMGVDHNKNQSWIGGSSSLFSDSGSQ